MTVTLAYYKIIWFRQHVSKIDSTYMI